MTQSNQRPEDDKDIVLAVAIACGQTQETAAKAAGVCRTTVARKVTDPAFRAMVSALRRQAVDRALGVLSNGCSDAAAQLILIASNGETESNRLKASVAVLELAAKYGDRADMEERVRQLEELYAKSQAANRTA